MTARDFCDAITLKGEKVRASTRLSVSSATTSSRLLRASWMMSVIRHSCCTSSSLSSSVSSSQLSDCAARLDSTAGRDSRRLCSSSVHSFRICSSAASRAWRGSGRIKLSQEGSRREHKKTRASLHHPPSSGCL